MKQVVHFVRSPDDCIVVGSSAYIRTTADHPGELEYRMENMQTLYGYVITTSKVLSVDDYGFETNNTMYLAVTWEEAINLNQKFREENDVI